MNVVCISAGTPGDALATGGRFTAKVTTVRSLQQRPAAASRQRSRMLEKSGATETAQAGKVTTARSLQQRPAAASRQRSRMLEKSEATETTQAAKVTTVRSLQQRPAAASRQRSLLSTESLRHA